MIACIYVCICTLIYCIHIHIYIYIHAARALAHTRLRALTVCGALLLQIQKPPLHYAAENGHGSVVGQLLQRGPTSTLRTRCVQGVGFLCFCGEMLICFLVEVIVCVCVDVCIHICIHVYIYYMVVYDII